MIRQERAQQIGLSEIASINILLVEDDYRREMQRGFTLIELSIVLVIIGLIAGGLLVGQDLIAAGAIRSQITQIDRYNTAVNVFKMKFGGLPGDITSSSAVKFGFPARGSYIGQGDGDGTLFGNGCNCSAATGSGGNFQTAGETVMFWVDLSQANLIDGRFSVANATTGPGADVTGSAVSNWLPEAKIGGGNYVYVWGSEYFASGTHPTGVNFFGIAGGINLAAVSSYGRMLSQPTMPVAAAFSIDDKIDDGKPQSGRVLAQLINTDPSWVDGTDLLYYPPVTSAVSASPTTCYDNGGSGGPQHYSMSQNNGNGVNCALSFKFY